MVANCEVRYSLQLNKYKPTFVSFVTPLSLRKFAILADIFSYSAHVFLSSPEMQASSFGIKSEIFSQIVAR